LGESHDRRHQPSTWRGHGSQYIRSLQNQSASTGTGGSSGPTSVRSKSTMLAKQLTGCRAT
jgi:hypothetical protein